MLSIKCALALIFSALIAMLCAAGPATTPHYVRLKYEVRPVKLEYAGQDSPDASLEFDTLSRIVTLVGVQVERDSYATCTLSFGSFEIIVERLGECVNLSYVFRNFTLVCHEKVAEHFNWLTHSAPPPTREGWQLIWISETLTLNRFLTLNPVTGEVRDAETGEALGEWIYQLRERELEKNSTVVLAALQQFRVEGFDGVATIVYVNFSQTAGRDYVLNNGRVRVSATRTAVGTSLYSRAYVGIVYNPPPDFVEQAKQAMLPGSRLLDFGNGTYAFVCSYIYDTYEEVKEFKPWKLEKVRYNYSYAGSPPWDVISGVVWYGNASYVVILLLPLTLVYDRATGILLEAVPALSEVPWLPTNYLPPPLPTYFRAAIWNVVSHNVLALRLVESSLHEPIAEVEEERGRSDTTFYAVITASIAGIALLRAKRKIIKV